MPLRRKQYEDLLNDDKKIETRNLDAKTTIPADVKFIEYDRTCKITDKFYYSTFCFLP